MSTGGPGCGRRLRRGRQPTPVNAIDFSKCAVTNQLMKATRRLEWLWAQSAAAPLGPFFLSLSLSLFHCLYHQRNWSRNMLKTAGRSCRISLMTGAGRREGGERVICKTLLKVLHRQAVPWVFGCVCHCSLMRLPLDFPILRMEFNAIRRCSFD